MQLLPAGHDFHDPAIRAPGIRLFVRSTGEPWIVRSDIRYYGLPGCAALALPLDAELETWVEAVQLV